MKKIFFLAIAVALSIVLNAQTQFTADEFFYSQRSDKILQMMYDECPSLGEDATFQYGLVDFDQDGISELWVRDASGDNGAFFCCGGGKLEIIAAAWSKSHVSVKGNVVCSSGSAGTGAFYTLYCVIENSTLAHNASDMQLHNFETNKLVHECEYDGKEVSWKWFKSNFLKKIGEGFDAPQNDVWMPFERLSKN